MAVNRHKHHACYNRSVILGLSCLLVFLYSLFYTGQNNGYSLGWFVFERIDLAASLLFMVLAFALLGVSSKRARESYFTGQIIWCHAILMVLGAAVALPDSYGLAAILLEGFLVGVSYAVLTCAWGLVLGQADSHEILVYVILSTLIASLICFLAFLLSLVVSAVWGLLSLFPLLSAALLVKCLHGTRTIAIDKESKVSSSLRLADFIASDDELSSTKVLSSKMYFGTFVFGLSAGVMETYGTDPGMNAVQAFPATLLFLALICISLMQFPLTRHTPSGDTHTKLLGDAYRLCFFVLMSGFLLTYVLSNFRIPGESIVLSAYLALVSIFMVLFILLSKLNNLDASIWFGRGFALLYGGELCGLLLGNIVEATGIAGEPPFASSVVAGIAALFSFLYLFTDKDFASLLSIADERDHFQKTCEQISASYGLSAREAEILPYALRGRTSGRIADELFISKSTVDTHLKRIYSKCGVHGRQELIDLCEPVRSFTNREG